MTDFSVAGRVLVTGGAGFVGSHLCEALIRQSADVLCIDNLLTGSPANLSGLEGHAGFEWHQHDVIQPLKASVSQIYNLACPASPVQYQADPIRTLRTSVLGAMNMLELAREEGATVLQASTSEVYGDPHVHPQTEDYWGHVNPIGIRSCYDEGKRCAETLFFDYWRQHNVPIKVVRIFNTYGPRMRPDDGRVVSTLIVQALRGEALTLFGDGQQTRSFCYVSDLVKGLIAMMQTGADMTGPINLGNPHEVTMRQLAETVLRLTGSRSAIAYRPLPSDDPRQRQPDISKAREALGWEPIVSLEDGLRETIDWFRHSLR